MPRSNPIACHSSLRRCAPAQHLAHDSRYLYGAGQSRPFVRATELGRMNAPQFSQRACQYLAVHRSMQLFSPTFKSPSLNLRRTWAGGTWSALAPSSGGHCSAGDSLCVNTLLKARRRESVVDAHKEARRQKSDTCERAHSGRVARTSQTAPPCTPSPADRGGVQNSDNGQIEKQSRPAYDAPAWPSRTPSSCPPRSEAHPAQQRPWQHALDTGWGPARSQHKGTALTDPAKLLSLP